MSLQTQILDTLRGCQLSGAELRHALSCTHEALYTELVRLEAKGCLRVLCDFHMRGRQCIRKWDLA